MTMKRIQLQKSFFTSPIAFGFNLLLVYIVYGLCRLAYLFENWSVLSEGFDKLSFWEAFKGCWMFDTSAILYTNALYAILMLLPLHVKETDWWQNMAKWIYITVNSLCIIANLSDAVYFQYTGRRTTTSVFLCAEPEFACRLSVQGDESCYQENACQYEIPMTKHFYAHDVGDVALVAEFLKDGGGGAATRVLEVNLIGEIGDDAQ